MDLDFRKEEVCWRSIRISLTYLLWFYLITVLYSQHLTFQAIRAFFVKVKKLLDAITKRLSDHSQKHHDEEARKEKELESV
jgi:hypothetical protein